MKHLNLNHNTQIINNKFLNRNAMNVKIFETKTNSPYVCLIVDWKM